MNAEQLAEKFRQKLSAAVAERERQAIIAAENKDKRTADIEHCKQAMEREVIPFLEELKHHFGKSSSPSLRRLSATTTVQSGFLSQSAMVLRPASQLHSATSS